RRVLFRSTLTIESPRAALGQKHFSATRLVEEFYKKIRAEDAEIHAYLTLCEDRARQQARAVDRMASAGEPLPPLAGVPVGIKDVMVTRGIRSTAGSKNLQHFIPPYDCTTGER